MISNSKLHHTILRFVIDNGYGPNVEELSKLLETTTGEVEESLNALQDYHGVVLHPKQPKVWAIHPFSLAPTNFIVKTKTGELFCFLCFRNRGDIDVQTTRERLSRQWGTKIAFLLSPTVYCFLIPIHAKTRGLLSGGKRWWGCCAWCSFGIAAILKEDVVITTSFGAHGEKADIAITDGEVEDEQLLVHFPVPMKDAWVNVIYTCSTMLVFQQVKDTKCSSSYQSKGNA